MPKLTDTELIATRLLGWEQKPTPQGWEHLGVNWYEHPDATMHVPAYKESGRQYSTEGEKCEPWPDLTNWNDIRRMEDALAEKGLLGKYVECLEDIVPIQPDYDQHLGWRCWKVMTATAAQRVAACVKVLREIERAEIDGRAK